MRGVREEELEFIFVVVDERDVMQHFWNGT